MLLRHATHRKNLESIRKFGLDLSFSTGTRTAVWLHAAARSVWAAWHVADRHSWMVDDVVILTLDVPPSGVRKHGPRGVYYCLDSIPAACILEVNELPPLRSTGKVVE